MMNLKTWLDYGKKQDALFPFQENGGQAINPLFWE